MKLRNAITLCMKALSCLALVMALALAPASESHASGIGHNDHIVKVQVETDAVQVTSFTNLRHGSADETVSSQGDQDAFTLCCNALCLSIVLNDNEHIVVNDDKRENRLILRTQTASVDPSGVLRPPQLSI